MDHRYVIPLPEEWTFDDGAAYLVQVLTAYYALVILGDLKENQTVLIHSAAGGVGIWANRIAKNYNAYTIGTVGTDRKIDFLKEEGYNDVIVRSDNFRKDLQDTLGSRELNIVMECIGGKILMDAYVTMAAMGRMIVYGSARYMSPTDKPNWLKMAILYLKRPKIDPQMMPEQNKAIMGFNLIYLFERNELLHKYLGELAKLDIGKPHIGQTFEFDQVQDAVRELLGGKTKGKLVIRTDNF